MKAKLIILSVCLVSSIPAFSAWSDYFSLKNFYVSMAGVGAATSSDSLKQSYGSLPADEEIPSLNKADLNYNTGGIQLSLGHQAEFNQFGTRTSLQYLYLASNDKQTSPFYNTDVFNSAFIKHVSVQSLLFDVGLSRHLSSTFQLYADAGIGAAFLRTYATYATNSSSLAVAQSRTNYRANFAWQAGMGGLYQLTRNWSIEGGIHYINFGDASFGSFAQTPSLPGGVHISANNFSAALFSLGLDYSLDNLVTRAC